MQACSLFNCFANPSSSYVHLFSTKLVRKQSMKWQIRLFVIYALRCVYLCSLTPHKDIIGYGACLCCRATKTRAGTQVTFWMERLVKTTSSHFERHKWICWLVMHLQYRKDDTRATVYAVLLNPGQLKEWLLDCLLLKVDYWTAYFQNHHIIWEWWVDPSVPPNCTIKAVQKQNHPLYFPLHIISMFIQHSPSPHFLLVYPHPVPSHPNFSLVA